MTTQVIQVAASSDDARENSGTMGLTAPTFNSSGTNQKLGFRFTGVNIAQGETVTAATLSFYLTTTAADSPNGATIGMEAADDAATFTTTTNDITNRTRTSTVAWSGTDIGTGWHDVDVTTPVQAVVDRGGWVSGNDMAALLYGVSGTALTIQAYDGDFSLAAKLTITHTPSGGGGAATKAAYYARARA